MSQHWPPTARTITLGGGCFWCTEAIFSRVRGVLHVESGYCNGHVQHPTYERVCQGDTGHAEVVQVVYDSSVIALRDVLQIFFATHDPTTLNRQGHDVGTQYRSGIYYSDEADREVAHAVRDQVNQALDGQVVTEIQALSQYHRAEDYHQAYFANHPGQGYCVAVIAPKVYGFEQHFRKWLIDA
jgi:peptide-methionine (S)-S-oxide reductase